jgi:hypothetical protein
MLKQLMEAVRLAALPAHARARERERARVFTAARAQSDDEGDGAPRTKNEIAVSVPTHRGCRTSSDH